MNIPSFKLRRELSVKDKNYVIYGILSRADSIYDKESNRLVVKYNSIIEKILKKYKIKYKIEDDKIYLTGLKKRYYEKYTVNSSVFPKYVSKRLHPLGIYLLIHDNMYNSLDNKLIIDLEHFNISEKIRLIDRLNNFNILAELINGRIVLEKDSSSILIKYFIYYL